MSSGNETVPSVYTDEMDIALGRYVRSWSQQEALVKALVAGLTGMRAETTYTIFLRTPISTLMETCKTLADAHLPADESDAVSTWLAALKLASRDRNELLHGGWLEMVNGPGSSAPTHLSTKSNKGRLVVTTTTMTATEIETRGQTLREAWKAFEGLSPNVIASMTFPPERTQ